MNGFARKHSSQFYSHPFQLIEIFLCKLLNGENGHLEEQWQSILFFPKVSVLYYLLSDVEVSS